MTPLGEDPNLEMPKLSETFSKLWGKVKETLRKFKLPELWRLKVQMRDDLTIRFLPVMILAIVSMMILLFVVFGTSKSQPVASNTLHKIEQCMKDQRSGLLDDTSVLKALCAEKYSVEVDDDLIKGRGGYKFKGNKVYWSASIENKSTYIITEFAITVRTGKDKKDTERWRIYNQWIEPEETHKVTLSKLKNLPEARTVQLKLVDADSWSWGVDGVRGILIVE